MVFARGLRNKTYWVGEVPKRDTKRDKFVFLVEC